MSECLCKGKKNLVSLIIRWLDLYSYGNIHKNLYEVYVCDCPPIYIYMQELMSNYKVTHTKLLSSDCVNLFFLNILQSFCAVFCRLSFVLLSYGHCIVCPLNYGFWLPDWYIQTFYRNHLSYIHTSIRLSQFGDIWLTLLSYYVSSRPEFRVVISVTISA